MVSLILGLGVIVLGETIRFWGVSIAGSETRTTGKVGGTYLITNGPFAHVRNPLYVGNMLLYAGIGVMSLALFPWLLIGAVCWFYIQYYLIVTQEEEYLAQAFGEDYRHYCSHVGRFVPRMSAYVGPHVPPKRAKFGEGLTSERRTLQAIGLVVLVLVIVFALRNGSS